MLFSILNSMPGDPGWTRPLPRGAGGGESWLYPIMITIGFVVAIVLACIKMWKRYKISVEPFYWFILIGVPLAIFGANFGSCVLGEPAGKKWSEFFTKFGQGLAIEWGVMFVVVAACIYFPLILKKPRYRVRDEFGPTPVVRQVSMWLYFDAVMPCILIAQFLGRWGNYFNQEVYGAVLKESQEGLAWFLYKCLPGMYINGAWHQPLFFWEGLGNLAMFFVLYIGFEFIKQRKTGDLAACYVTWYGLFRACLETLRDEQFKSTKTIVLSILFAVAGVLFIVYNHLFMARARDKKGAKLLFSKFGGMFFQTFFVSHKTYDKRIIRLSSKIKKLEGKKSLTNKQKKKIAKLQEKLEYCKAYDFRMQAKIIIKCQDKIESLNQVMIDVKNGQARLNPMKLDNKINLWENRLSGAEEILNDIKQGKAKWCFPKDCLRTDNEKVFFSRW